MIEERLLSGFRFREGRAIAVDARLTGRLDDHRWRADLRPMGATRAGDRLRFGETTESPACLLAFLDAELAEDDDGPILVFALSGPVLDESLERLAKRRDHTETGNDL